MAKRTVSILGWLALILGIAPLASAEWYVGGYAGASFPNTADLDAAVLGVKQTNKDVDFDTSAIFGGKLGYWLAPFPYVGLELQVDHHSPDASSQTVSFVVDGQEGGRDKIGKLDLGVTTVGFNLLARVPGNRFQPYLGVGPGVFITRFKDTGRGGFSLVTPPGKKDTDTSVGVQALGGLKIFITKHIAFFTEYKFTHHKFEVRLRDEFLGKTDVMTRLNSHYVYGGLAYHF